MFFSVRNWLWNCKNIQINNFLLQIIGFGVFQGCSSLSQVTLVNGVTVISYFMFAMVDLFGNAVPSSLGSVTVPSSVTSVGY